MSIDMTINRREIRVRPENRVKKIKKLPDGSLAVDFYSGASGVVPADEPEIQSFVVFSVLSDL